MAECFPAEPTLSLILNALAVGVIIIDQTLGNPKPPSVAQSPVSASLSSEAALDTEDAQDWRALCEQYRGDVYAMASALGVHRTTVIRKLKKYGLAYARKPRVVRSVPRTGD